MSSWVPPIEFFFGQSDKTFQYDDLLPSLPIPPLDHTLIMYLESVKPLVSQNDYQQTERVVQEFKEGVGQQLQIRLLEKYAGSRNWLEKYWDEHTYLSWRGSVVPYMQMTGLAFTEILKPPLGEGKGFEYASLHIYFCMEFWKRLRKEEIVSEVTRKGARHTMHQLKCLFNTNRLPGEKIDYIVSHFNTDDECPSHVIINCHGHLYSLETIDVTGDLYTPPEIETQLRLIWSDAHKQGQGQRLGALVADKRVNWWKMRNQLKTLDPQNIINFDILEKAAFSITLEDGSVFDAEESVVDGLVGNVGNRWLEKSISLLVWPNGHLLFVVDHTCMEVPAGAMLCNYVCSGTKPVLDKGWLKDVPTRDLPQPKPLYFRLDKKIEESIGENIATCAVMHRSIGIYLLDVDDIGKELMKSWRLHPDAVVQAALQLGYYKLHGKPAPVYETASTREFYRGRTETCRTCTAEVVEFCRAMLDSNKSKEEKRVLLKAATLKHTQLMEVCTNNHGCDRHLLGLKLLAQEEGRRTPEIFLDPSWTKSGGDGNFVLSTSLGAYIPSRGGTIPMCMDGYGAFYGIGNTCIKIFLASYLPSTETDIKSYASSVQWAFDAIRALYADSSL